MATVESISKRAGKAFERARERHHLLDDLHKYVIPYREPKGQSGSGAQRVDRIFDSTAPKAAFRFAGRMQLDVTPDFQRFFELKLGPAAQGTPDQKKRVTEGLETSSHMVLALLQARSFSLAAHEMYMDLFGGTGAMLMLEDEDDILRFVSVPVSEIALREDGFGSVVGVYWNREFPAEELEYSWDNPTLSKELKDLIKNDGDRPVKVCQACELNRKTKKWEFTVFVANDAKKYGLIHESEHRTSPWLTPRFYKVPGEEMGRGPGLLGLPTVKTLNRVTELSLQAAMFAILGLWTARNDGVFNPKTARMVPGGILKVQSNGGPMGPSLQRLETPGRFDVANLVLQDLRDNAKQAMFDDTLPPDTGAVRSATEIVERLKRLNQDLAGAYSRLVLEIVRPLVQRCLDVLARRGFLPADLDIDQMLLKIDVVAPIARGQQAQDVSNIIEWLEIMNALAGREGMMLNAKIETLFAEIGRKLGVSESYLRSEDEKKMLQQQIAQIMAAQQGAADQPEGAAPATQPAA